MPNFDDFLSQIAMAAINDARTEQKEKAEAERVNKQREAEAAKNKAACEAAKKDACIKKAIDAISEEERQGIDDFAAHLFYTYISICGTGFTPAQAVDLTKALISNKN